MLRDACNEMGLTLPKYDRSASIKRARTETPIEQFLVEGASCSRGNLRRRLIKEGFLQEACYAPGCTTTAIWNNKPLTLQLEHKNGVWNDNRLENLELLCPNCHSQTDTWCSKKKPKKTKEKQKQIRSKKIDWPSDETLEDMVKVLGFSGAGRKLGVSDNAVRKHLKAIRLAS